VLFWRVTTTTILLPSGLKKSSSGLFAPDILPQQQQNKRTTSTFHNSSNPHCQSCDIFFLLGQGTSAQPQPHDLHYYRGPDPRSILGLVNKENIRVWAVDPSVVSTGYKCEAQPTILPDVCFVNNKRNVKEVQDEKSQVSFFYIFLREQKKHKYLPLILTIEAFLLRHHRNYLK